ncbi:MAG: FAD-binding oxidoreductase, partial [Acidimicrobiales bacterium]
AATVEIGEGLLSRLRGVCAEVDAGDQSRAEAARDWWPLAIHWAKAGQVPALPSAVARPADAAQVAGVLRLCNEARVPVTPMAGRSGVCGGSLPVFGGLALDLCALSGILEVDDDSLLVDVAAGTFGTDLEDGVRAGHGLTIGHWPQSVAISTVGGWLACRSAGQYSTRYGKIEDIVAGVEVVLADGRAVETGGRAPRAAVGPDLTQAFVGSEGTLGVITRARLRAHPVPQAEERAAWAFPSFGAGLEACRRTLRRDATPAVLRLHDAAEAARRFGAAEPALLIALDEGDRALVGPAMGVLAEECRAEGGRPLDDELVGRWLATRNDVADLGALAAKGIVVDTVEVAARWSALLDLYRAGVDGLAAVEGTLGASAHQSHAYPGGACLYFTFAGRPADGTGDPAWAEAYYRRAWGAVMAATLAAGGAISHHHGIGLNRGPWLPEGLGAGFGVLQSLKAALDPAGILNPGKLGLASPFGAPPWP